MHPPAAPSRRLLGLPAVSLRSRPCTRTQAQARCRCVIAKISEATKQAADGRLEEREKKTVVKVYANKLLSLYIFFFLCFTFLSFKIWDELLFLMSGIQSIGK